MREQHFEYRSEADDLVIAAIKWAPERARAIVQISHGLAEHSRRYRRLAKALTGAGYAVYGNDHRGHGATLKGAPGDFGEAGWEGLVADMAQLGRIARSENEGLPHILLGHSMGSFAVQQFLLDGSRDVDAAILSGSSDFAALAPLAAAGADFSFAALNAGFEPARTKFDWLSRDAREVDAYIADPLCGFDAPAEATAGMFSAGSRFADPEQLARIRSDLPLLIFSGNRDPVSAGGALLDGLVARYRDAGLTNLTLKLYDDGRHEMFNETSRDEVTAEVIAWIECAVLN